MTKTHVAFLLDESGSMDSISADLIGGFNQYVETLKRDKDNKYVMTVALFEGVNYRTLVEHKALSGVPKLSRDNYRPGGGTPLWDSLARLIEQVVSAKKEDEKVLFVVYTDGEENQSKNWKASQVNVMIKALEAFGATFVYMGASQDAWKNERAFLGTGMHVNSFRSAGGAGTRSAYNHLANSTMMYAASAGNQSMNVVNDDQKSAVANDSGIK